jgi:hypothetical protein
MSADPGVKNNMPGMAVSFFCMMDTCWPQLPRLQGSYLDLSILLAAYPPTRHERDIDSNLNQLHNCCVLGKRWACECRQMPGYKATAFQYSLSKMHKVLYISVSVYGHKPHAISLKHCVAKVNPCNPCDGMTARPCAGHMHWAAVLHAHSCNNSIHPQVFKHTLCTMPTVELRAIKTVGTSCAGETSLQLLQKHWRVEPQASMVR